MRPCGPQRLYFQFKGDLGLGLIRERNKTNDYVEIIYVVLVTYSKRNINTDVIYFLSK